jgi:hypothetical protein
MMYVCRKKNYSESFEEVVQYIICKCCVHMYVNVKMRPVETVPQMGEERIT